MDDVPCGVVATARRRFRLLRGDPDRRAHRTADLVAAAGPQRCGPVERPISGQLRACLIRPKSFIYHFAAEALLALIESLGHELPDWG